MAALKLLALKGSVTGLPWSTGIVHTQICTSCGKKSDAMYRKCVDCSHAVCKDCFNSEGMQHAGLCRSGQRWFPTLAQEQEILAVHGAQAPIRPSSLPEPAGHREDWKEWTSASAAASAAPASLSAPAAPSTPSRNATIGGPFANAGNGGSSLFGSSPTLGIPILNKPKDWRSPVKKERKRKAKPEVESSPPPASGRRKISNTRSAPVAKPAPIAEPAPIAKPAPIAEPAPIAKPVSSAQLPAQTPFGLKFPAVRQTVRKVVVTKAADTPKTSSNSNVSDASSNAKMYTSTKTTKASTSSKTSSTTKASASTGPNASTKAPSSTKATSSTATANVPASTIVTPSPAMLQAIKMSEPLETSRKGDEKALSVALREDNEIGKKKVLSSALHVPGKSTRSGLDMRVRFVDLHITKNFDTDEEDEGDDDAILKKSDAGSQALVPKTSMRGKANARGLPLDRTEQLSKHDPNTPWLESIDESRSGGEPASSLGFGVPAPVGPIAVSDEPDVPESNERGRPVTRMTSERNRESSGGSKKPARKRREYSPYSESMLTGTSDVNRLGPSSHASTENVLQSYLNATAASGVVTLDVRGIDTLTLKTAPGFYMRTDPTGKEVVLPAQVFYQWRGEGIDTLHQEFVLHVDDAKNPPQELIGSRDIPANGAFEGYQLSNEKMSDVQSAIISAKPRRARVEKAAKPAKTAKPAKPADK